MMIALNEWQHSLLTRVEKENCTDYGIKEIKGEYYIKVDDLLDALDETQNYRQYAEEEIVNLTNKLNDMPDVEVNTLQLSTIKKLNELRIENDELKKENEKLRKEIEDIQSTLDEDDYNKLHMEGIEI